MLEIKKLEPTRKNLKKFVQFQIDMYKGNEYFVPPLVSDDMDTLDPAKNPAAEFCESVLFMAYRDGKPVGRIAGILHKKANKKFNEKNVRFGFLDFVDDTEVSEALFKAVEEWGKERGMQQLVGPLGFSDMDYEGLLIEGYEELSTMATIYNYPYYPKHLERLGFAKEADWVEYVINVPDGVPERYTRIADLVSKKYGLKVLKVTSRKYLRKNYGQKIFDLINTAYKDLYQYCELSDRQIKHYIDIYLGLLDLNLVSMVIDEQDNLLGVGISMASLSQALRKSHGKLFPFGWYHLLRGLAGKTDRVDLLLVAVDPAYQNKGVNALIFNDLIPNYNRKGFKYAESNPELELNMKVQNQWEYFEHRLAKRRRSYIKSI